ncbi:MAG TPA: DUF4384 domain-containing protein [Pyrinomonadaceae bacterium]|nr:DUF4384 domain-containing protein [Pyrinomonadaceae bacterium]
MSPKLLGAMLAAVALLAGIVVSAQQPDEAVRGAFLESRPKTTNLNAPSRRHRRRPSANKNANANNSSATAMNVNAVNSNASAHMHGAKKSLPAIGIGYTLFMRDSDGRGVRVEPTREFRNGDRVRIALETNTDGYLYIFDSEDGAPARMIYPDVRLDGGENWIEAHVPMEIPSSDESEERLRWFEFYGKPGGDRIYVVLTREPLASVPISDELVAFCGLNKDKCPWQPPSDVWARIEKGAKANVKVATTKNFGQAQTETEKVATTRGLGLDKSAPQPAVIRINASTSEPVLVTVLDLVHK